MPLRRRFPRVRRTTRAIRRRFVRRNGFKKIRAGRNLKIGSQVHFFKRHTFSTIMIRDFTTGMSTSSNTYAETVELTSVVASQTTQYYAGLMVFNLDMLPTITDFTSLFDRYMILGLAVKIFSNSGVMDAGEGNVVNGSWNPRLHWIIDKDGLFNLTANAAGLELMRQYPGYRTGVISRKPMKRYFKPGLRQSGLQDISNAVTNTGIIESGRRWIDMANTDVAHYSIPFIIEWQNPNSNTNKFSFQIKTTYYLKFGGVR